MPEIAILGIFSNLWELQDFVIIETVIINIEASLVSVNLDMEWFLSVCEAHFPFKQRLTVHQ